MLNPNNSVNPFYYEAFRFFLGIDGDPTVDKISLTYSEEVGMWYLDAHLSLGITVIDPSDVAVLRLK